MQNLGIPPKAGFILAFYIVPTLSRMLDKIGIILHFEIYIFHFLEPLFLFKDNHD